MAGELCGRGCGWCGRCDAEPDDVCGACGRIDCRGDCRESIEANQDERRDDTGDAGVTVPLWLQSAFSDWLTCRVYVDGRGNYRSRVPGRVIVPYNRSLKRLYPENQDFHRAAHLWLTLWEAVPTARLTRAGRTGQAESAVRS